MTYTEIAQSIPDDNRRILAHDLALKLDALNNAMQTATDGAAQGKIVFNPVDKEYQANMRLYLLAQKQFFSLLPQNMGGTGNETDALTAFNS